MKIVINKCYGGFSLSYKAVMRYAELKGIKLYPFLDNTTKEVYGNKAKIGNNELLHHYSTKPVKNNSECDGNSYFSDCTIERDDKFLVKVVEEMGKKANGRNAKLKIVKIPNNVKWYIENYDGIEHIAEKHRKWS